MTHRWTTIRRPLSTLRPAFTMIELMVSLAVLVGIMTMVAAIFATTSKAGGRATASATVYRYLRQAGDTIRKDLEGMQPGRDGNAVLGIAGVEVNALNKVGGTAGMHRADVLMLFTDRGLRPYVFEDPSIELANTTQVVYGHANIGKLDASGNFTGTIDYVEGNNGAGATPPATSNMFASQWHLARRVIAFPAITYGAVPPLPDGMGPNTGTPLLTNPAFRDGRWDVFGDPFSAPTDTRSVRQLPSSRFAPPGCYEFLNNATQYYYVAFDGDPTYGSNIYRSPGYLFDTGHWYVWLAGAWIRSEDSGSGPTPIPGPIGPPPPSLAPPPTDFNDIPANTFYGGWNTRTLIDPAPPMQYADRLGAYFLPACSDFLVEYTYDDPREILVDGGGNIINTDADGLPDAQPVRWQAVLPGHQIIWSRISANPPITDRTDPHRWPRALRITLSVYDAGGRLEQPIVQTFIHVWQ